MNFTTVICPQCGQRVTVSAAAPPILTCPTCLAKLDNPLAQVSPAMPRPVIPLEYQVERDTRAATATVIVLCTLLIVGGAFAFTATSISWAGYYGLLAIPPIFACAAVLVLIFTRRPPIQTQLREAAAYGDAMRYGLPWDTTRSTPGQFIIGVVIAGAACVALFIFEMAYAQSHSFRLSTSERIFAWTVILGGFVALLAWSIWRGRRDGEWGWLAGILTGLCVGALPIGFCGMVAGLAGG